MKRFCPDSGPEFWIRGVSGQVLSHGDDMELGPVRIDIYYVGGCPNRQTTAERVREVLNELCVVGEVREVQINPKWASLFHFLGSPTVQINRLDVELSARASNAFNISCRTYRDGQLIDGAPSIEMIRQAVLEARRTPVR
jgi:hypothetical protein